MTKAFDVHGLPCASCAAKTENAGEKFSIGKVVRLLAGIVAFVIGVILQWILGINEIIPLALFVLSYFLLGGNVVLKAVRNIAKGKIFDENFLMTVATIGAFAIGKHAEAVIVMLFYQIGELLQEMAVRKSKRRISELMDIRPDFANLHTSDGLRKVSPKEVNIGDIIVIKSGEKIPLDGIVLEGEAMLDTSALTGESIPRKAAASDIILSGCINQNGALTVQVTQTFGESTASKIIDLIENAASKKAPTETFITKFARYYTPIVMIIAVLLAVIPPLFFGGAWSDWISRSLIFLVISCPCALVVSIPLGFFGGIGAASKRGVLIKGGNYLEALGSLDLVVFDKTGTLTKGVFKVTSIHPTNGYESAELLELVAYAETFSNHPIALSIMKEYGREVDQCGLSQYREIAGYGVSVICHGRSIVAGNDKLMKKMKINFEEIKNIGTKIYIAVNGEFAGCIIISDEIKLDSRDAITLLKKLGVKKTVMLTGDTPQIAKAIARELKIDEVYSGLLPGQKVDKIEMLNKEKFSKGTLAFVGDGINDAPVLAMADIGVAMGGLGSDAAIEAADVVLMTDEPTKLVEAIKVARFTRRIVWQNIIFALGVKFLFLFLGTLGVSSLWEAVFADVGVTLLSILNTIRILNFRGYAQ